MKIGIVISGGDVSGMNNFIFQIARQADADITLFNGGIPGLLEKNHQDIAWRDLVDFSITAVPIITSGRTSRKLQRSEYEMIAKEGANKQVISSQADSLIKISRIWADFFPANTSNQPV
ncbi:putative 6-phosphofructokinase [Klebsiella quasipneumoniae]|nr:putative 6-phosphofructokinase [Klebsiella quasipneumoniae]VGE70400.1 putative 6-phosphofructokinase [Klebsiella quasipneumoniae]VGE78563.1 putative 6-phosphofructokinase [Klebsiella quasipneumoniae]VGE78662.1 putative 6-phosphofructokinase [Klebsiella quasipneumoniae]VGE79028.1 putative 6-phosphofructokinase [Klebsiella quasipneumoniae]